MKKLLTLLSLLPCMLKAQDEPLIKRLSPVPVRVNDIKEIKYDLRGIWYFNPSTENGFENNITLDKSWDRIQVPGEWVMQGFKVKKNQWAGYARSFDVPADWKGKRIKLRCDAVYSESDIFIDGNQVGWHLGGFTPFEFDITDFVKIGVPSIISIKVKNESVADSLASGSQYAVHSLGGITRKIQLIALPDVNFSLFHVVTTFDKEYRNAVLTSSVQLANESNTSVNNALLSFELFAPGSNEHVFSKQIILNDTLKPNNILNKIFEFPVINPKKWDTEHPNLYKLQMTLKLDGKVEVAERLVGFRQIEVRGNQVFVNNRPVKLRGVCRHEVSPLGGRSLNNNQWKEDVKIFREGNVNYIRTSHYPPAEELVEACDSLGMFLEVEAPFCWVDITPIPKQLPQAALVQQTLDMVNFFKSNPSVLIWSMGNESRKFKEYFSKTAALVKVLDPTRPRNFSQFVPDGDDGELEIGNVHYPGTDGADKYRNNKRPIVFDEYCHLNAYNRIELVTDQGVRDAWGIGMEAMWEKMYAAQAVLGGALWAGIDDTFILPDGKVIGYGTWGVIDGWRRMKPEFWHMKKVYSPVKIKLGSNWENSVVKLLIENRLLFSNLNECHIQWKTGKYSGSINPSIEPYSIKSVELKIPIKPSPTDTLFIDVYDPRKVLIDQYAFNIMPAFVEKKKANIQLRLKYVKKEDVITAHAAYFDIALNKKTGNINVSKVNWKSESLNFGKLMILPLNGEGHGIQMTGESQQFEPFTNTCANRTIKKIETDCSARKFSIKIYDTYDEAHGYILFQFSADKKLVINYHYLINKEINPRQWGLVFTLPDNFNRLSWKRKGLWNYYPEDHIGRLSGKANAFSSVLISGPAGPVQKPLYSWSLDRNEMGTNDFRSTKMNITEAAISDGNSLVKVVSDGSQHIRVWKENKKTNVLIAGYSNLGSEGFFRSHAQKFDIPLKTGDIIENTIHFSLE